MKFRLGTICAIALAIAMSSYVAFAKDKEPAAAADKAKDTMTEMKHADMKHAKKDDAKSDKEDEIDPKKVKLFGEWKLILSSLSDDQKVKMQKIHEAALAAKKEIEAKESDDLTKVLTPEQQKELAAAVEKHDAEVKAEKEKMKELKAKEKAGDK